MKLNTNISLDNNPSVAENKFYPVNPTELSDLNMTPHDDQSMFTHHEELSLKSNMIKSML
jgi:hypothetical protein